MEEEIVCPSGLTGKIRPLRVSDEPLIQDAKLIKSGRLIYELCNRCWVSTSDLGIYKFADKNNFDWNDCLQGDAMWVFMQIRRITYGDDYEFAWNCDGCGHQNPGEMYFSELDCFEPSPEGVEAYVSGTTISEVTDSGQEFSFKLLTGRDEVTIANYEKGRNLSRVIASLCARLQSVVGVEGPQALMRWVEALPAGTAEELVEIMDEHECGIDTDIEQTCEKCGKDCVFPFPLGPSFFRRKRKERTKRNSRRRKSVKNSAE